MGLTCDERINVCFSLARCLPTAAAALADGLDDMLDRAQEWFGPRDRACVVTGLWFGGDHPKVSYPQRPAKHAQIRLSEGALREALRGDLHYPFWQLAHETVHLLSPTPGHRVNVLEEGLACCFQDWYMRGYPGYAVPSQHMPSFIEAEALARGLLALDADIIKNVRLTEPVIGQIGADALRLCCPALPLEEAKALAGRFYRHGPPPDDGTWPFQDPRTSTVVVSAAVVEGGAPILTVTRDTRDGVWQFSDGAGGDFASVSLTDVVQRDSSVVELADLPVGGRAWRRTAASSWQRGSCP